MCQESGWILDEMTRVTQAERLAEGARYRMVPAAPGVSVPARRLLAKALWSLATVLDGEARPTMRPSRRSAGGL